MKLVKCHIDGFGAFSQKDFDFKDNLTSLLEENGFGKTTLSAFLKAMLYGLDKASPKSFDDRKRYLPWSASEFGGSLTFSVNGKEYTVIRSFGKQSASHDTASLVLTSSGEKTSDFDITSLGQDLFGIDKEGFMRSTFSNGEPNLSALPSSIRSQIGISQEDGADDMGSYEKGEKNLSNAIKELEGTSSRKKGKIALQKDFVYDTQKEIRDLINGKSEVERLDGEKDELLKIQKELNEKLQTADRFDGINTKLQNYRNLLAQIKGFEAKNKEISEKYSGKNVKASALLPLKQKIEEYKNKKALYNSVIERIESEQSQKLLNIFGNSAISDADLDFLNKSVFEVEENKKETVKLNAELQNDREELLDIRLKTTDKFPTDEQLLNMKTAGVLPVKSTCSGKKMLPVIAILSALLAGSIGILFVNFYVGLVVLVLSAVFLMGVAIFAIISKSNAMGGTQVAMKSEEVKEILEQFGYSLDADLTRVSDEIKKAKELSIKIVQTEGEIADLEKETEEKIRKIEEGLAPFGLVSADYSQSVSTLLNAFSKYKNQVLNDVESEKSLNQDLEKLFDEIKGGFSLCGVENFFSDGFDAKYEETKADFEELERNSTHIQNLKTDAQNQYNDNKLSEYEGKELLKISLEERKEIEQILRNINYQIETITSAQARIYPSGYEVLCDEIEEKESEIAEAERFIEKAEKKLSVLKKTLDFLESAKTSFVKKYAGKVTDSFKKYSQMFSGSVPEEIIVSPELEISAIKMSAARNIEGFSNGQKSIMDVCLRLSLIDAMFEKEKPFLILDDPFVSLDEKNFENAGSLIKEASKQCQIIYLTCHNSREIKGE